MKCVFYYWRGMNPIVCKENAEYMWKGFSFCEHHIHMVVKDPEGTLLICQRMD